MKISEEGILKLETKGSEQNITSPRHTSLSLRNTYECIVRSRLEVAAETRFTSSGFVLSLPAVTFYDLGPHELLKPGTFQCSRAISCLSQPKVEPNNEDSQASYGNNRYDADPFWPTAESPFGCRCETLNCDFLLCLFHTSWTGTSQQQVLVGIASMVPPWSLITSWTQISEPSTCVILVILFWSPFWAFSTAKICCFCCRLLNIRQEDGTPRRALLDNRPLSWVVSLSWISPLSETCISILPSITFTTQMSIWSVALETFWKFKNLWCRRYSSNLWTRGCKHPIQRVKATSLKLLSIIMVLWKQESLPFTMKGYRLRFEPYLRWLGSALIPWAMNATSDFLCSRLLFQWEPLYFCQRSWKIQRNFAARQMSMKQCCSRPALLFERHRELSRNGQIKVYGGLAFCKAWIVLIRGYKV